MYRRFSRRVKVTCTMAAPSNEFYMWDPNEPEIDLPSQPVLHIKISYFGHRDVFIESLGFILKGGKSYIPPCWEGKKWRTLKDGGEPINGEINLEELSEASREEGLFIWAFAKESGRTIFKGDLPEEMIQAGLATKPHFIRRVVKRLKSSL